MTAPQLFVAAVAGAMILLTTPAAGGETERYWQELLCDGMETEVVLPDRARVDCLDDTHVWEVDWSEKWAEAIGQSVYYAAVTGRKPGIILLCRRTLETCREHLRRLVAAAEALDLRVTVWMHTVEPADPPGS